ncbi:MAG: phosphoenolpyruvate mutase, partial [Alphaproteobacteria bacterium]|nr:phosphoenolpyruvate mutase [Alphaproteobacteria bacterium]
YYKTPTDEYRKARIAVAIWANHNMRAAISAMRETCRQIHREESIAGVEKNVVSVQEVFELAGNDELAEAEKRYLPRPPGDRRAILLAASRGAELGALTEDRPKCMIEVRGQPLLRRLIGTVREAGVRDITVVRGYKKEVINFPSIDMVDNDLFMASGEATSLACAIDRLKGETLIAYGDILFRHHILDQLFAAEGDIVVTVDALWRERQSESRNWVRDFAECTRPFSPTYLDDEPVHLRRIASDLAEDKVGGEWMGLAKLGARGAEMVRDTLQAMRADGTLAKAGLPELFTRMAADGANIRVLYVAGQWLDVDNASDLARAGTFL